MTTLVLGLDGASFELLDPWIKSGRLPTLARLKDEAVTTDMESALPPVTCPNWQAYATGTNPGKLGVFWWERIDTDAREIVQTSSSDDFHGTHYWRYLNGDSAIVNLPTSYPPPPIDGMHVAGGPGADQSGYATPFGIEERLESEYGYAVHPERLGELSWDTPESPCVEEIYDLIETRFDVVADLLSSGDYELVHLTIFYINVLQHFFWNGEPTRHAWELIDEHLGDLLAAGHADTVFLLSDHGSTPIDVSFRINAWLEAEGYLATETGVGDVLHAAGVTRERVRPILASLGIEWWLRRYVPRRVQTMLPAADGSVTKSAKASAIDWDNTRAIASGQGPLYVVATDPTERRQIRDELQKRLEGLTHDGIQILSAVHNAEDIYDGPYLDRGPDLVLDQAPGIHIAESLGGQRAIFDRPEAWRAENKTTGLFAAYGDSIDPMAELTDMHILDVAPTILHLHGQDVPSDVDGRVRMDLFADGSAPARRPVRTREPLHVGENGNPDAVESGVTERLEDLGYLQ